MRKQMDKGGKEGCPGPTRGMYHVTICIQYTSRLKKKIKHLQNIRHKKPACPQKNQTVVH